MKTQIKADNEILIGNGNMVLLPSGDPFCETKGFDQKGRAQRIVKAVNILTHLEKEFKSLVDANKKQNKYFYLKQLLQQSEQK